MTKKRKQSRKRKTIDWPMIISLLLSALSLLIQILDFWFK